MNDKTCWLKTLDNIKNIMEPLPFNTWFSQLEFLDIKDSKLRLVVPYILYKDHIEKNYKNLILENINNFTNEKIVDVSFILKDNLDSILKEEQEEIKEQEVIKISHIENKNSNFNFKSNLNKNYTFDNFVVGESNKFAQAAALAVAENPGVLYNPLFIYGNSGLGKTHLMHAIGNYIEDRHHKKVLYVPCDQFLEDFMGLSRKKNNLDYVEFFKCKYRDIDVLIIDDIQFLGGASASQQEFFHTFNNLHNNSKQIIVSSDRSPEDLKALEDRLRTRFCWGLQVDISPPDYDLKVAILRKKLKGEKIALNDDIIDYIANNIGNDVRGLEGSLTRLVAYSCIMGVSSPNLEFAMEALKDFTKKTVVTDQNNIRRIQKSVANFYKISFEDIKSKKRPPNIAIPRQVAMFLCRKLTDEPFERIGIEFGGKNHATVMHSCNKIEREMKNNKELSDAIAEIEKDLR